MMGGGSSGLFGGRKFTDNLSRLSKRFEFNHQTGYFGVVGQSRRGYVRNLFGENRLKTAEEFFQIASVGSIIRPMKNGKGTEAVFNDGSKLTFRPTSKSDGSPAIELDINTTKVKKQRIHFMNKE
jgi:hypothetical protein